MLKADLFGVGVIGTGRAGLVHARNFAGNIPGARLTAICDTDPERAAQVGRELSVKAYSNVEDFLSDPTLDAVVIAAPTFAHAELVKAAAAAGKAILCEKPLCLTLEGGGGDGRRRGEARGCFCDGLHAPL